MGRGQGWRWGNCEEPAGFNLFHSLTETLSSAWVWLFSERLFLVSLCRISTSYYPYHSTCLWLSFLRYESGKVNPTLPSSWALQMLNAIIGVKMLWGLCFDESEKKNSIHSLQSIYSQCITPVIYIPCSQRAISPGGCKHSPFPTFPGLSHADLHCRHAQPSLD